MENEIFTCLDLRDCLALVINKLIEQFWMLDYDSNDKIERVFNYQFVFNHNFVLGDHARDEFK